jgi:hypothetical protein
MQRAFTLVQVSFPSHPFNIQFVEARGSGGGVDVKQVKPGSLASEHIATGDHLLTVNGIDVSQAAFADIKIQIDPKAFTPTQEKPAKLTFKRAATVAP